MAVLGWLGSRVVSVLDWGAVGPVFKSQPRRCLVTVLGKLFTPIVPLFTRIGSRPLKGCEDNCGPGGKYWQPTAGFITHVTCRLTANNRDQLRNHTLGNRVWATFTFIIIIMQRLTCVHVSVMRLSNRKRDLLLSCQFQSDKAVNFRQNNVLCLQLTSLSSSSLSFISLIKCNFQWYKRICQMRRNSKAEYPALTAAHVT